MSRPPDVRIGRDDHGGRVVPVTRTRRRRRVPFKDPVTYIYAVAALVLTPLAENLATALLTYLRLR